MTLRLHTTSNLTFYGFQEKVMSQQINIVKQQVMMTGM